MLWRWRGELIIIKFELEIIKIVKKYNFWLEWIKIKITKKYKLNRRN